MRIRQGVKDTEELVDKELEEQEHIKREEEKEKATLGFSGYIN